MSTQAARFPGALDHAPTAREVVLRTRDLAVAAGERVLVRPVSLEVGAGELVAVIGPSGAGKTSLLRALAGVLPPHTGDVELTADAGAHPTGIGFVPADDLLHDELTVFEELLFAARLRVPADTGDPLQRVMDVMAELRLSELTDARVATLSKGERRRTSCGVELVGRPRVLVLDEPGSGLDPGLEVRLMVMLRRIADEGRAVLFATHSVASLERCDTVVVMGPGGVVRYVGPPAGLCGAFGVDDLASVYTELEQGRSDDIGAPALAAVPGSRPASVQRPARTPAGQLSTVLARAAICRLRDRRSLTLMLGQAPVLGAAIAVVLPLAGALIPIDRLLPPLQLLSEGVLGRWSLSGLGGAIGLDTRVGSSLSGVTGLEASFFDGSALTPALASAIALVVALGFATRALAR